MSVHSSDPLHKISCNKIPYKWNEDVQILRIDEFLDIPGEFHRIPPWKVKLQI